MYPEDRVLVGVVNRKADIEKLKTEHWYRIPVARGPKRVHAEYIAFYLSQRILADQQLKGGIYYFARRTGSELVSRRDLLPEEANHPRADAQYHKLQFAKLQRKSPPILNPTNRPVSFIYTTWDRFEKARVIADLYSKADYFVDRVFHALGRERREYARYAEQVWEASRQSDDGGAQIRVECENGIVIASTRPQDEHVIPLTVSDDPAAAQVSAQEIIAAIQRQGGPLMISIPIE